MEVRLKGRVPVSSGFLLLQEDNIEIVGGPVEQLVREWRAAAQNRALALNPGFGTSAPVFQALTKDVCFIKKPYALLDGHHDDDDMHRCLFNSRDNNRETSVLILQHQQLQFNNNKLNKNQFNNQSNIMRFMWKEFHHKNL